MSRKPIITDDCLETIVDAYVDKCVSLTEIASWFGVTRQGVWKFLKRHGVETRKGFATRRELVCDECGKVYLVNRSRYRSGVAQKRHFCTDICYHVYLENTGSRVNRHKQRIARMKVGEVFDLQPGHVVHHKDSDHFNTSLDNFLVFANQGDHIRYHHEVRQGSVSVVPVWDGAAVAGGYFNPQPKKGGR